MKAWGAVLAAVLVLACPALAQARNVPCPADGPIRSRLPEPPPRDIALSDLLRHPRQPSAKLERIVVNTEGTLLRVRSVTCKGGGRLFHLWLGQHPHAAHAAHGRNHADAVVVQVPAAIAVQQLGSEAALERLVGHVVRVTGRLSFNPSRRGELARSRGTLWEIRSVTTIAAVRPAEKTPAPPPAPAPADIKENEPQR